jgi:hypothetical protein
MLRAGSRVWGDGCWVKGVGFRVEELLGYRGLGVSGFRVNRRGAWGFTV